MKKKWLNISVLLIVGLLVLFGCGTDEDNEIVIGGKNYTEQYIMAEMLSQLIEEHTELETKTQINLAGSVIFDAITAGQIDLYLEYTGTGLINIGKEPSTDAAEVYNTVKQEFEEQFDIKWLEPYGFNNTYAMVVTQETAEEYNLKTYSDMAQIGEELVLGSTHVFTEREDGYPGLTSHYDFDFADVRGMDPGLMYTALVENEVDVISAFATEGRIAAYDLVILEDDQQFFPPYDAAPIVRMDVLERHPELEEVLNLLAGRMDDLTMGELNASVDLDKQEPADVARSFLISEGLIEE